MSKSLGFDKWLTPERLLIEEAHWGMEAVKHRGPHQNAGAVSEAMITFGGSTILEYGCGTGWIPWLLREEYKQVIFSYHGIDNQELCLEVARERCPLDYWSKADILESIPVVGYDIVCTFSMMKHIPLGKWQEVWTKVQEAAPIVVAGLNMCRHIGPVDDGDAYVHNWVPESWIFDGDKRVHYMRKNWEGEHGSDILVTLVDRELYDAKRPA